MELYHQDHDEVVCSGTARTTAHSTSITYSLVAWLTEEDKGLRHNEEDGKAALEEALTSLSRMD